jgi:hypothetical protein
MKKLIIFILLVVGVLSVQAQRKESYSNFHYGAARDSMEIRVTDNVYGISVAVPSTATDSVEVWGNAKTIDGKVATYIAVGPNEYYHTRGEAPLNYLYLVIRAGSSPRIATMTPISR